MVQSNEERSEEPNGPDEGASTPKKAAPRAKKRPAVKRKKKAATAKKKTVSSKKKATTRKKAAKKKTAASKKTTPKKKAASKKKAAPKKKATAKKKATPKKKAVAAKKPVRRKKKPAEAVPPVEAVPAAEEGVSANRPRRRRRRRPVGAPVVANADLGPPTEIESPPRRRKSRRRRKGGSAEPRTPETPETPDTPETPETPKEERRRKGRRRKKAGGKDKERKPDEAKDRPKDRPKERPKDRPKDRPKERAKERPEDRSKDRGKRRRDEEAEDVVGVEDEGDQTPTEKVLLVNAMDPEEVRIALLEDKQVEELYVEAAEGRSATGNVYRGRVQNVERGIGAAFVDLGRGLTGFLHVSDLPDRGPKAAISDLVEPGQEVLVQVTRDSIGRKGPALTARISLPGRYLVLLTTSDRSGVSRRIGKGSVRERARRFLEALELPEGMGVIVRTAGEDSRLEDLQRDLDHLLGEWKRLEALAAQSGPPTLLRAESDVAERAIRDIMPTDTVRIAVDREDLAARIRTLLTTWYGPIPLRKIPGDSLDADAESPGGPRPMPEVVIHDEMMPLLHAYGVEAQLEEAFRRVVRLPSGGSIVIDPTEALVSIDVNSGRFTEEEDPESTALATNLEAVKEIARQLRLRDLGGLVVLDLIDMPGRRSGRQVEKAFKRALARDRARIRVGHIGPFGCLILSRQRVRQALSRVTHEECQACGGTGRRRHPAGLGLRVLREMQSRAARAHGRGGLEVRVPRPVREWILRHRASLLRKIETGLSGPLKLEADDRLAADGWAMKGLPPTGESPERPE